MNDPRETSISNFTYELPDEKIASHPLDKRDASKLLIYKNGEIFQDIYANIASHLPSGALMVFNNTKVINARLRFTKATGGIIEIFCLEPNESVNEYATVLNMKGSARWKCFIGGVSKWKEEFISKIFDDHQLHAKIIEKLTDCYVVEFSWNPVDLSLAEVLEKAGDIPLPPYIKRAAETADRQRYQTIYAEHEGSVAAPTAGLHFTSNIFEDLFRKNILTENITLHVGAGTFKPVKASFMGNHEMHSEWIDVSISAIQSILKSESVFAVGTTSCRTIESLYWLGVKTIIQPEIKNLEVRQWEVYEQPLASNNISVEVALRALINWLEKRNENRIFTQTQLLIMPGYRFRILKGLITNFHQPQSTLLLLVAAATNNEWKKLYDHALANDFRFLSYGDGNLIFIDQG